MSEAQVTNLLNLLREARSDIEMLTCALADIGIGGTTDLIGRPKALRLYREMRKKYGDDASVIPHLESAPSDDARAQSSEELAQAREEIDRLRTIIDNKYADAYGGHCRAHAAAKKAEAERESAERKCRELEADAACWRKMVEIYEDGRGVDTHHAIIQTRIRVENALASQERNGREGE
jgi:hypothetical protein